MPRFCGCGECLLQRATPQHHDMAANDRKGPKADLRTCPVNGSFDCIANLGH